MKKIIFDEVTKNTIIQLYTKEQKSLREVSKITGIGRNVLKSFLTDGNTEIRRKPHRKYELDEDYFEEINSSEKAYWLGFIAADGFVSSLNRRSHYLGIRLHPKDEEHLNKFLKAIKSNSPIQHRINSGFSEGQPCVDINICSNKMVKDLKNKGIVDNKSLILKPPSFLNEKFIFDFLRGYYDGDGSLIINRITSYPTVVFCGTEEMLNWIKKLINYDGKLEQRVKSNKNTYVLRLLNKESSMRFLDGIYKNNGVSLDRKYQKYKLIKSSI